MDEYVTQLRRDGRWRAPSDLPLPSDVEIVPSAPPMGSDMVAPPMGLAEVRRTEKVEQALKADE